MKSQYFVIKTMDNEKKFAKLDTELTTKEFMSYFLDYAKEAYPITQAEYKRCTGEE